MKIGIISSEYLPATGGAETYLENLIKVLESAGHKIHVYQLNNGVTSQKTVLLPHKPSFIPGGRALDLWWYSFRLLFEIPKLSNEDILIVNYAFHSWPVFWHKKVIVLSHGCEWDIPTTSLSQRLKVFIAKWSFKRFKYLVANDTNYFRQMGISIKPKENKFQEVLPGKWFLPNAVDLTNFKYTKPDSKIKKLNAILVPRNVSYARGVHLSIQSFALFHKKFPGTNLVIVGKYGKDSYKEYLDQIIKENHLENSVHFIGSIPWQQMPTIYSAGQLTVITTLQREGTSLAGLESMACGVATVSTNCWGLADLPTEQSEPNPKDLATVMVKTYKNRKTISKAQQDEVKKYFNLDLWGETWLKVVQETGK